MDSTVSLHWGGTARGAAHPRKAVGRLASDWSRLPRVGRDRISEGSFYRVTVGVQPVREEKPAGSKEDRVDTNHPDDCQSPVTRTKRHQDSESHRQKAAEPQAPGASNHSAHLDSG